MCLRVRVMVFNATLNNISVIQYSQRHSMINHCDRCITHLGDLDISFVLLNTSSKFLFHLKCYLLSLKRHINRLNRPKDISVSLRRVICLSQRFITLRLWLYCIMPISFIDGGNQSTRRKPPTCRKTLTNFITYVVLSIPRLNRIRTHNVSGDRHWLHR
jgi:hypothetical protein